MTDQSVAGPSSLVRAASDLSISSDSTCTPASEPKSPGFDVESNQSLDGGDGSTNTSPDDEMGQTSKGLSLPPTPTSTTNQLPSPTIRSSSSTPTGSSTPTQSQSITGSGGPPPRKPPGGGGPNMGSLAGVNERTRQLASSRLPPSLQAKLAANANRSSSNSSPMNVLGHDQRIDANSLLGPSGGIGAGIGSPPPMPNGIRGATGGPRFGGGGGGPMPRMSSSPATTSSSRSPMGGTGGPPAPGGGMKRNRPGLKLSDMGIGTEPLVPPQRGPPGVSHGLGSTTGTRAAPPKLSSGGGGGGNAMGSAFANFSKIVDPSGRLNFGGKAILHASGVEFGNGTSFKINMEDLELKQELGKGNYGTVRKVRHTTTNVEMAMKEIRLELDESKLNGIIMELDILHRATAPEIVEFYGAFFIESCVYYCMEFMDAGSLEKLCKGKATVPDPVLARVTSSMVKGLRFLKDELQIMHRDVKPTNVLVNRKGQVKLCDFGVSGQLEKSLAKTNIGCQSYMAPERIKGESQNMLGTYTVASDVWSLGLSMVEMTLGTYPYPPETYSNVFAQLQAIVHGDRPQMPGKGEGPYDYSEEANDFVNRCLEKIPERRPTYAELLRHPFLLADEERGDSVDMVGWVNTALKETVGNEENGESESPRETPDLPELKDDLTIATA